MEEKHESVKIERAEIDTRSPFRSVKEAVSMFGVGVLAADSNSRQLKQTSPAGGSNLKSITAELEETKLNLEKSREETELMTTQMSSLKEELDNTRRELQQLKEIRKSSYNPFDSDEDLKFVKDSPHSVDVHDHWHEEEEGEKEDTEFHKKRYVTFAHPTLSQIILPEDNPNPVLLEKKSHIKTKKKSLSRLLPLFGGIFPKRKAKCDM